VSSLIRWARVRPSIVDRNASLRPRGPLSVPETEHLTRYGTLHVWPAKYAGHNQPLGGFAMSASTSTMSARE
jgi:hypothetical protein